MHAGCGCVPKKGRKKGTIIRNAKNKMDKLKVMQMLPENAKVYVEKRELVRELERVPEEKELVVGRDFYVEVAEWLPEGIEFIRMGNSSGENEYERVSEKVSFFEKVKRFLGGENE